MQCFSEAAERHAREARLRAEEEDWQRHRALVAAAQKAEPQAVAVASPAAAQEAPPQADAADEPDPNDGESDAFAQLCNMDGSPDERVQEASPQAGAAGKLGHDSDDGGESFRDVSEAPDTAAAEQGLPSPRDLGPSDTDAKAAQPVPLKVSGRWKSGALLHCSKRGGVKRRPAASVKGKRATRRQPAPPPQSAASNAGTATVQLTPRRRPRPLMDGGKPRPKRTTPKPDTARRSAKKRPSAQTRRPAAKKRKVPRTRACNWLCNCNVQLLWQTRLLLKRNAIDQVTKAAALDFVFSDSRTRRRDRLDFCFMDGPRR